MTVFQYMAPVMNELDELLMSDFERNEPIVPLVEMDDSALSFPKVDILETKDHFILKAELPGFDKKDLDVIYEDGILTILAERKPDAEESQKFYYRERPMGNFERKFQLSRKIQKEGIRAVYREGVLSIYLPKVNSELAKEVKIH